MKSPLRFVLFVVVCAAVVGYFFADGRGAPTPGMFEDHLTYEQAAERSAKVGKPIFAVFSATWCGPCQAYKKGALADPRVEEIVRARMIPACIDVDQQRAAAERFQVSSIPATAIIKNGERVQGAIGLLNTDELLTFLEDAAAKARAE